MKKIIYLAFNSILSVKHNHIYFLTLNFIKPSIEEVNVITAIPSGQSLSKFMIQEVRH